MSARGRFRKLPLGEQSLVNVRNAVTGRFRRGRLFDNSDLHCSLLVVKLRWPRHVPA